MYLNYLSTSSFHRRVLFFLTDTVIVLRTESFATIAIAIIVSTIWRMKNNDKKQLNNAWIVILVRLNPR